MRRLGSDGSSVPRSNHGHGVDDTNDGEPELELESGPCGVHILLTNDAIGATLAWVQAEKRRVWRNGADHTVHR